MSTGRLSAPSAVTTASAPMTSTRRTWTPSMSWRRSTRSAMAPACERGQDRRDAGGHGHGRDEGRVGRQRDRGEGERDRGDAVGQVRGEGRRPQPPEVAGQVAQADDARQHRPGLAGALGDAGEGALPVGVDGRAGLVEVDGHRGVVGGDRLGALARLAVDLGVDDARRRRRRRRAAGRCASRSSCGTCRPGSPTTRTGRARRGGSDSRRSGRARAGPRRPPAPARTRGCRRGPPAGPTRRRRSGPRCSRRRRSATRRGRPRPRRPASARGARTRPACPRRTASRRPGRWGRRR